MTYLLLLLWPWAMAGSCWLLRRSVGLASLLAIAAVIVEGSLLFQTPVDDPVRLLGVGLLLSSGARFLSALIGGLVLLSLVLHSVEGTSPPLPALALAILGCLVATALFVPPLITAIFVLLAVMLATLLGVAITPPDPLPLRKAVLSSTIRLLVLGIVGWLLLSTGLVLQIVASPAAAILLVLGWAILLGLVPFQMWLMGNPNVVALPVLGLQMAVQLLPLLLIWHAIETRMLSETLTQQLLAGFGALTALGAALLALGAAPLRKITLLLQSHLGLLVLALALFTRTGATAALSLFATHVVAVALFLLALALLRRPSTERDSDEVWEQDGIAGTAGMIVALFTLLHVPPLGGFVPLLTIIAALRSTPVLLAIGGAALLFRAWASAQLVPVAGRQIQRSVSPQGHADTGAMQPVSKRFVPPVLRAALVVGVGLSLAMGIWPRLMLDPVATATELLRLTEAR